MDYLTHFKPQVGDAHGINGDLDVEWLREVDKYDEDNDGAAT